VFQHHACHRLEQTFARRQPLAGVVGSGSRLAELLARRARHHSLSESRVRLPGPPRFLRANTHLNQPQGFPESMHPATIRCARSRPRRHKSSATRAEPSRRGVAMRLAGPSRSTAIEPRAGVPPMAPQWPRGSRPAWLALVSWAPHTPVVHGPAGSTGRQPQPPTGVQGTAPSSPARQPPRANRRRSPLTANQ
jgi:hypothetical protein